MSCIFSSTGCSWNGDLTELSEHLDTCQYDVVSCPLKCGKLVLRSSLQDHLILSCKNQLKRCPHCGSGYGQETPAEHRVYCFKFPVPCPNNCSVGHINREDLVLHLNEECDENIVPCSFRKLGCAYEGPKFQTGLHLEESTKEHMSILCAVVVKNTNDMIQLLTKNEEQKQRIESLEDRMALLEARTFQEENATERELRVRRNNSTVEYHKKVAELETQVNTLKKLCTDHSTILKEIEQRAERRAACRGRRGLGGNYACAPPLHLQPPVHNKRFF